MKATLFVLSILLISTPVFADFQGGTDAYNRGDYKAALKEWKPFAEDGVAAAQNNRGWMYPHGQGVKKNDIQALMWWDIAATMKTNKAAQKVYEIREKMTPADVSIALDLARECVAKNYTGCIPADAIVSDAMEGEDSTSQQPEVAERACLAADKVLAQKSEIAGQSKITGLSEILSIAIKTVVVTTKPEPFVSGFTELGPGSRLIEAKEGYSYLKLMVEITNSSDKQVHISFDDFKTNYASGDGIELFTKMMTAWVSLNTMDAGGSIDKRATKSKEFLLLIRTDCIKGATLTYLGNTYPIAIGE